MISLLPSPSDGLCQILLCDLFAAGKVTGSNLRVNLDARVGWDQVVGNIVSLVDGNTRFNNRVVFPKQEREQSVRVTISPRGNWVIQHLPAGRTNVLGKGNIPSE